MLKTSKLLLNLSTALLLLASSLAQAADAPPSISEMWTMKPKADQRTEFFAALKEHMAFRSEAGDPRVWKTYTPMLGDDINLVGVRYCCFEWADADAYRDWSEANPEVGKHFNETVGPYVETYGHYFNRVDWANSNLERGWGPYRYFGATDFTVKPGMAGEFDAVRDKISQIALNQGWATEGRPWIWSTSVGGVPTETIVSPFKNYADMDREGESFLNFLSRVMGSDEKAEELFQRFSAAVAEQEYQVWELHEDLSMQWPE